MDKEYHTKKLDTIYEEFNSSIERLKNSDIEELLIRDGKNEPPHKKIPSTFYIFISQFKNPMEIILIITVILSLIIGEIINGISLIMIILVDVIIGTVEELKAIKSAFSLMDMIKVTTKVIRGSKKLEIDSSELVVGDIMLLESGDKISADARIIECHNFQINEASLTGESTSVVKKNTIFQKQLLSNPLIFITIIGSILLQIIVSNISITGKLLNIVPLDYFTTLKIFILSLLIIVIFEIYKLIYNKIKEVKK